MLGSNALEGERNHGPACPTDSELPRGCEHSGAGGDLWRRSEDDAEGAAGHTIGEVLKHAALCAAVRFRFQREYNHERPHESLQD
jgi:transposase InsO family protein